MTLHGGERASLKVEGGGERGFGRVETDFGHPYPTDFGQTDFGPNRLWPNRLWPKLKFLLYIKILVFGS